MARDECPMLDRGQYETNDVSEWKGKIRVFEDLDYSVQGAKPTRTNNPVTCLCVKNNSGFALLPKRLVTLKALAGNVVAEVAGYADVTAEAFAVAVDEFLGSAGVPDQAYFWVVIDGPATLLTDIAAVDTIAVGDRLVSLTAASSGATSAGRVDKQDLTGATAVLANQIQNAFGFAMEAKSAGNTNADILCYMTRKW